jgi:HTH-type transcriptional regulator/antitoxin HipB
MSEPRTWGYVSTPADLGHLLRALREEQGLSQERLAEDLGITRQYLHELETGKPTLYATRLFTLLRLLGARIKVETLP